MTALECDLSSKIQNNGDVDKLTTILTEFPVEKGKRYFEKNGINYSMAFKSTLLSNIDSVPVSWTRCLSYMAIIMLPKCVLSMKVRTYNPTPLVHQVNNSH